MTDRTVSVRLRMEVADSIAKTRLAAKAVQDYGRDMARSLQQHQRAWDDVAQTTTVAAVAIGAAVGGAVKAYADFDAQMSQVAAAAQVGGAAMQALRDEAIAVGKASKYSAVEAAQGAEELVKANVAVQDIVGGGLKASLDLAAAGGQTVAEAAAAAADAMTQFNIKGKDAGYVADVLSAGAGKAQGSVHELGMALSQSGLVASQYDMTLGQTVGTLALFATNGLKGSDAGTALKTMLLALNPASDEAAELMDRLNLRAYDAQGQFIGMAAYAGKLRAGLADLSDEQRNAALKTIFGNDAIRAANILYAGGAESVQEWTEKVNDQGYAARSAAIQMDNLKGDVEKFTGALSTAFIDAGSAGNDFARSATQGLTELVELWSALPQWVQGGTLAVGAAGTAAAIAAVGIVKLASGYRSLIENLQMMGPLGVRSAAGLSRIQTVLTGPAGIGIAAGFAAATLALGTWARKQEEARARVKALTEAIREDNGVVAENTREQVARELQERKLVNIAKAYGVGLKDLTDAALGNADAMARVQIATMTYLNANPTAVASVQHFEDSIRDQNGELQNAVQSYKDLAEMTGETGETSSRAAGGLSTLAGGVGTAADEVRTLDDRINDLNTGLSALYDRTYGVAEAQDGFASALNRMNEAAKDAKGKTRGNSEEQIALRDALRGSYRAALDVVTAQAETGASSKDLATTTERLKQKFIEQATKAGISKTAVKDYAAAFDKIPAAVKTAIETPGLSAAAEAVKNLDVQLDKVDGRVVHVSYSQSGKPVAGTNVDGGRIGPVGRAAGGLIPGPPSTADTVPAYLSTGEYVIKASAVSKYGTHLFDHLNAERFASGGQVGTGSAGIGDLLSTYQTRLGQPVRPEDRTAAVRRQRDATEALRIAEIRLREVQKDRKHTASQLAGAEERVRKAREALGTATQRVIDLDKRAAAQRQSPFAQLGGALSGGIKDGAEFVRNIEWLASHGYGELARQLAEQGDANAEKIAADAIRQSPAALTKLQNQLRQATGIEKQRDNLADIVRLIDALRVRPKGTIAELAQQSGLDPQQVIDLARLMGAQALGGVPGGKSLLAQLPRLAGGGLIPGPPSTSDTVPAWLSTGEYVVSAAAVRSVGTALLDRINARRYASGGLVAASRAGAVSGASSSAEGGRTLVLQLDSAVAARSAAGYIREARRAEARDEGLRSRRRP